MLVQSQNYTLDEYRALQETTEYKHEYHDGEIVSMTGGSINHNRLIRNFISLLNTALKNKPYEVFPSDMRLWIPQYRKGLYTDVMVIAGEPVLNEGRTDEVINPCLIIEVLSPSTAGYDRGDKFLYYRSIPEFQEYLLVSQSEYRIEHYLKTGENQWLLQDYQGSEVAINLESVKVTLVMQEIYEGVNFELVEG